MAGVGEASAIIGFVSTAATLSKSVIEIATQYKNARVQIESFGRELSILGKILGQLDRLQSRDASCIDISVRLLIDEIVDECFALFSQLGAYNDRLCGKSESLDATLRTKTKWVFQAAELEYLRARVDSMKINVLLMMTFQAVNSSHDLRDECNVQEEHTRSIQRLASQSDACISRLQRLEDGMTAMMNSDPAVEIGSEASIATFETANTTRSMRDSILSLYDDTPYSATLGLVSDLGFITTHGVEANDSSTISDIVEDYLNKPIPMLTNDELYEEQTDDFGDAQVEWQGYIEPALCLDDGGVKTYSALLILQRLMAEVANLESLMTSDESRHRLNTHFTPKSQEPNIHIRATALNHQPCRYFDYIVGASTGGLLAMMLGRYRMSIQECLKEFRSVLRCMFHAPRVVSLRGPVFWPQPKYDHNDVEAMFKLLEDRFFVSKQEKGEEGTFKSIQRCKTQVSMECLGKADLTLSSAVLAQLNTRAFPTPILYGFRSYGRPHRSYEQTLSQKAHISTDIIEKLKPWEISRALLAKRGYFSSFPISGAYFEGSAREYSDPAYWTVQEIKSLTDLSKPTRTYLICVGSGVSPWTTTQTHWPQNLKPLGIPKTRPKANSFSYTRFNAGPKLSTIKYDQWEYGTASVESTIEKITRFTQNYLADPGVQEQIRHVAKYLVKKRKNRSKENNEFYISDPALWGRLAQV